VPSSSSRETRARSQAETRSEASSQGARWLALWLCCATLLGCVEERRPRVVVSTSSSPVWTHTALAERPHPFTTEVGIARARQHLAQAVAAAIPVNARLWARAFVIAIESEDFDSARSILSAHTIPTTAAVAFALVRLELANGELSSARQQAWRGAQRHPKWRFRFTNLYLESLRQDEDFDKQPVLLGPDDFERLELLGSGTGLVYRVVQRNRPAFAFKAQQSLWFANAHGEIAAYRLCRFLECSFDVPRNRPARFPRSLFLRRLVNAASSQSKTHSELRWSEQGRYLDGTLKDWVKRFTHFPIARYEVWEELLDPQEPLEPWRHRSLASLLRRLGDPAMELDLLEHAADTTPIEFARQLSDLHVFDVLLDNWDRNGEANCQWSNGRLLSIDNGASFPTPKRSTTEAQMRLKWRVGRFSRRTIERIRWCDPYRVFALIWGQESLDEEDESRRQTFLERRDWLLRHVDALIAQYGEAEVLAFP
jgi:hypothetical protein